MATEGEAKLPATAAATTSQAEATRGAGGKLKRQTARRHQTTPYSRPPLNQVQRRPWISRIVDPAYRIISGGATRLLPYFFSNTASAPAITAPQNDEEQHHQDELYDDAKEDDLSVTPTLNKPESVPKRESAPVEKGGTSSTANENFSNINAPKRGTNDVFALSELERLMEGKTFSQAETDRLIEIINSRAIDLPDVTRDERKDIPMKEGANIDMSFLDKRKEPIGGRDAISEHWGTPTPLAKPTIFDGGKQVRDEVGLSPAELAKAYMGGQTSSSSSRGFVAKSSVASPSGKPSPRWPGVQINEQYGFATPQSQRENFGLQNFPRTPYSRTILSSSKSKLMQLQDNGSKRQSTFQSPSQSAQTRYDQLNLSKGRDGGLFGPNRRPRQSVTMSPYSRPVSGTSRFENSAIWKFSEAEESSNLSRSQIGTTYDKHKGSEVGTPTVPTRSSQTARTILDHLHRIQPTPKNKSAELKLATSWRHPPSSKTVEQSSSNINDAKKDSSAKLNEDIRNVFSYNPPSSVDKLPAATTEDRQTAMAKTASASNGIFRGTDATDSSGTGLPYELEKSKVSLFGRTHEKDSVRAVSNSFGGEPANLPKPATSHPVGNNKPTLASIAVNKPSQRWAFPSGSNATFTFPVSSSDGASGSEPSTPSIMPFTVIPPAPPSSVAEAVKDDEIPKFAFNGNRGGDKERLVFAFPSASEEAVEDGDDERLGVKFTFGSEKSERLGLFV